MSTSILYHAFQLEGVKYNSTFFEEDTLVFHAEINSSYLCCSNCKSTDVIGKGQRDRRFYLPPMGRKRCFLQLRMRRTFCNKCHQLHWTHLPFMRGKSPLTRSFARIALDLLSFSTIKSVSEFLTVGWDCIKDLHKEKLKRDYKSIPLKNIDYISIDEFAIAKGHEYMTIFTDISSGRIIHAIEGKNKKAIEPFLKKLSRKAYKLKGIAMDMSPAFYAAVKKRVTSCGYCFRSFPYNANDD